MISPAARLTHSREAGVRRVRRRLTTALNSSHQLAEPTKTPATSSPLGERAAVTAAQTQPGKNCHERENGHRVGEGQEKCGNIISHKTGAWAGGLGGCFGWPGQQGFYPQKAQEKPAQQAQPGLLLHQKSRRQGQPAGCHQTITGVSRGRPQPGDQPGQPAAFKRAPDAQNADRSDRRGN